MADESTDVKRKTRVSGRSPNHPMVDLSIALERAEAVHKEYGRHEVPLETAHQLWKYKAGSAAGDQCVAALKYYGLVSTSGQGKERKLTVTDEAHRIIKNAPNRGELIKKAALAPPIHAEIAEEFRDKGFPPDDLFKRHLVWERPEGKRFTEAAAGPFISRLRETFRLAGISNGDKIDDSSPRNTVENESHPKVGDFVQWTHQGTDFFATPQRVAGISEDGAFGFVEGSPTGLPMDELSAVDPPKSDEPPQNPFYKPPEDDDLSGQGTAKERTTLDEGPVVLTMPDNLSGDSVQDFEYWAKGIMRRLRRKAGLPTEDE